MTAEKPVSIEAVLAEALGKAAEGSLRDIFERVGDLFSARSQVAYADYLLRLIECRRALLSLGMPHLVGALDEMITDAVAQMHSQLPAPDPIADESSARSSS